MDETSKPEAATPAQTPSAGSSESGRTLQPNANIMPANATPLAAPVAPSGAATAGAAAAAGTAGKKSLISQDVKSQAASAAAQAAANKVLGDKVPEAPKRFLVAAAGGAAEGAVNGAGAGAAVGASARGLEEAKSIRDDKKAVPSGEESPVSPGVAPEGGGASIKEVTGEPGRSDRSDHQRRGDDRSGSRSEKADPAKPTESSPAAGSSDASSVRAASGTGTGASSSGASPTSGASSSASSTSEIHAAPKTVKTTSGSSSGSTSQNASGTGPSRHAQGDALKMNLVREAMDSSSDGQNGTGGVTAGKVAAVGAGATAAPGVAFGMAFVLLMNFLKSMFMQLIAMVMTLFQLIGGMIMQALTTVVGFVSKPFVAIGSFVSNAVALVTGGAAVIPVAAAAAGSAALSGLSIIALIAGLFSGIFGGIGGGTGPRPAVCAPLISAPGGTPPGPVDASTEQNAKDVYSVLKTWGMPEENIAGILGNWTNESSIDPTSVQGFYTNKFVMTEEKQSAALETANGIGLGQWTAGRNTLLRDYAAAKGANWWDLGLQLQFMADKAGDNAGSVSVIEHMISTSLGTPEDAATYFHDDWEISADDADGIAARGEQARMWFGRMSGWTVDSGRVTELVGDFVGGSGGLINVIISVAGCAITNAPDTSGFPDRDGKTEPGPWGGYTNGGIPRSVLVNIPWAPNEVLRADALADLVKMNQAFKLRFGYDIGISDSYRDYAQQVAAKAEHGDNAAEPGTSNHGWAMALDLGTGIASFYSPEYAWMKQFGPTFGWVHPAWAEPSGSLPEPWHWEYYGVAK